MFTIRFPSKQISDKVKTLIFLYRITRLCPVIDCFTEANIHFSWWVFHVHVCQEFKRSWLTFTLSLNSMFACVVLTFGCVCRISSKVLKASTLNLINSPSKSKLLCRISLCLISCSTMLEATCWKMKTGLHWFKYCDISNNFSHFSYLRTITPVYSLIHLLWIIFNVFI